MKDVSGRVAFITGGASGSGLGMAQAFSEAGVKVAIADVREDHPIEQPMPCCWTRLVNRVANRL